MEAFGTLRRIVGRSIGALPSSLGIKSARFRVAARIGYECIERCFTPGLLRQQNEPAAIQASNRRRFRPNIVTLQKRTVTVNSYIKSKQRVADHGEVLTGEREVNAMLDLVARETERIESRFLEPACGTGNFLVEILRRKLAVVSSRYKTNPHEWQRNAVVATSSIYGIDILQDNVVECRVRLRALIARFHEDALNMPVSPPLAASIRAILDLNIIWGDALTLKAVDSGRPIVFSEWSPVNGSLIKRRDFEFHELVHRRRSDPPSFGKRQRSLFGDDKTLFDDEEPPLVSDSGQAVFIPQPVLDHPLVHFLEIGHESVREL
jgi:hypothetical protein